MRGCRPRPSGCASRLIDELATDDGEDDGEDEDDDEHEDDDEEEDEDEDDFLAGALVIALSYSALPWDFRTSRASHALAYVQMPSAVRLAKPSAAAASSIVMPTK